MCMCVRACVRSCVRACVCACTYFSSLDPDPSLLMVSDLENRPTQELQNQIHIVIIIVVAHILQIFINIIIIINNAKLNKDTFFFSAN